MDQPLSRLGKEENNIIRGACKTETLSDVKKNKEKQSWIPKENSVR